jgi:hypothetical protein
MSLKQARINPKLTSYLYERKYNMKLPLEQSLGWYFSKNINSINAVI